MATSSGHLEGLGETLIPAINRLQDIFSQMRQEILQETERITGANKGISDKAIRLKICSPHVL
ncbi:hypothetical protein ABBQ38_010093 [Trebouxia sp. C0009 RCD-2024]